MRTIFLAGVLAAGMVGFGGFGGVAVAQDDTTTTTETTTTTTTTTTTEETTSSGSSSEETVPAEESSSEESFVEIPLLVPPRVTTASLCEGGAGSAEVTITNPNDLDVTYGVSVGDDLSQEVTVAADSTEVVVFADVAAGDHVVRIKYNGQTVEQSVVSVDRCSEITEPVDDQLQVFVRCEDGVGLVTIRVFNTEGESRTYTVSVDDLELPGEIELGVDEYAVVVDEAPAPDGTYTVRVVAEGIDRTETAEVACAPVTSTTVSTPGTTTTPAPQPRPAPAANSGGLASTGAAVGGIAVLALLALGLGGGLVIAARRRRPSTGD